MPLNLFDQVVTQLLNDNTVDSAGLGQGTGEYNSGDTYQPGDARIPNVLGATIKRKGKVTKEKKKRKKKKLARSS